MGHAVVDVGYPRHADQRGIVMEDLTEDWPTQPTTPVGDTSLPAVLLGRAATDRTDDTRPGDEASRREFVLTEPGRTHRLKLPVETRRMDVHCG
jgi:hypothetical protein